jgi:nucleoid-associated protein YgaU
MEGNMAVKDSNPDFSDVVSGGSSTAPAPAVAKAPAPARTPRTYVVVKGDNLSKIASKLYGKGHRWRAIHEANKALIKNPDVIQPGWVLQIPD